MIKRIETYSIDSWGIGGSALNKQKSPLGQLRGASSRQSLESFRTGRTEGVWGHGPHFFWGVGYPRPILPNDLKLPHIMQAKERITMNNDNNRFYKTKPEDQNRANLLPIVITLCTTLLLSGWATINRDSRAIRSILKKENTLIEKILEERSASEVQQGILENDVLKKAEGHLVTSLNELLKANQAIQNNLLKDTEEKKEYVRNNR